MSEKKYIDENVKFSNSIPFHFEYELGDKDKVKVVNCYLKTLKDIYLTVEDDKGARMPVWIIPEIEPLEIQEFEIDLSGLKSISKFFAETAYHYTAVLPDDEEYNEIVNTYKIWNTDLTKLMSDYKKANSIENIRDVLPKVESVVETNTEGKYIQEKYDNYEWRVGNPIRLVPFVNSKNKKILIKNYGLIDFKNVKIQVKKNDKVVDIFLIENLKSFERYIISFPFVDESYTYEISCDDENYKWFKDNIRTNWKMRIQNDISLNTAKNAIKQITMIAATVSSKLFEVAMDHYHEFVSDNGGNIRNFGRLVNDENKKKCYYQCLGVDSMKFGGRPWNNNWVVGAGASDKVMELGYVANEYHAGGYNNGTLLRVKEDRVNDISKSHVINVKLTHEVGHSWGCGHAGIWTHSIYEKNKSVKAPTVDSEPFIIPEIANLIAPDCPYYKFYGNSGIPCGYTSVDIWVYKNAEQYVDKEIADKYKKRLEENRELRNQRANHFNSIQPSKYPWKAEYIYPWGWGANQSRTTACVKEMTDYLNRNCDQSAKEYFDMTGYNIGYRVCTLDI